MIISGKKNINQLKPIVSIIFILKGLHEQSLAAPQDSSAADCAHKPDIEALPLRMAGAPKVLFQSMVSVIWH